MNTFPAWLITDSDKKPVVTLTNLSESDLMPGDVTVKVEYSALNYKDALAMTSSAPIIRKFPLVPGIDLAGTVLHSQSALFKAGDKVLLNGYGIGEIHSGGYASLARVNSEWLVKLPQHLTTRQAMSIGTAGYTAMLAVMALENHPITPDAGRILVTGASGGVGSVSVSILSKLGYTISATTGRLQERDYLIGLGADEVLDRREFSLQARPLGKERWAGAIDVAGGMTLANVISQVQIAGAVAACGLADSMQLPTSVAPFILRGVTLYGIDSVNCPMAKRIVAWDRLVTDLDMDVLDSMTTEIEFESVLDFSRDLLAGQLHGRTIVKLPD